MVSAAVTEATRAKSAAAWRVPGRDERVADGVLQQAQQPAHLVQLSRGHAGASL